MTQHPHLSDLELVEFVDRRMSGRDRMIAAAHLWDCMHCRRRLNNDRGETVEVVDATPLELPSELPNIPQPLHDALADSTPVAPQTDQLWQIETQRGASIALTVEMADEHVLVVPVTFDPEMADNYTLTVPTENSPLGLPLAIWIALRTTIPRDALRTHLVDASGLALAGQVHDAYERHLDHRPLEPADPLSVGPPILHPFDARLRYREQLMDDFQLLGPPLAGREPVVVETAPAETPASSHVLTAGQEELDRAITVTFKRHERVDDLVDDVWGHAIGRPLVPVGIADLLGMRLRVCALPGESSLADINWDELLQAAEATLLLRDCEQLAVVADNEYLDTLILNAWDLHPAHITVTGESRTEGRWSPEQAKPLAEVIDEFADMYLSAPALEPPPRIEIEAVSTSELASRHARDAIDQVRSRSPRIEAKKAALATLSDEDAARLARLVATIHASGPSVLHEGLEAIAEEDQ